MAYKVKRQDWDEEEADNVGKACRYHGGSKATMSTQVQSHKPYIVAYMFYLQI